MRTNPMGDDSEEDDSDLVPYQPGDILHAVESFARRGNRHRAIWPIDPNTQTHGTPLPPRLQKVWHCLVNAGDEIILQNLSQRS